MPTKLNQKFRLAFSMCVITFTLTIGWWLSFLILSPMGFQIPPFDAAQCAVLLTPIFGLLFGQNWIAMREKQNNNDNQN